MVDRLSGGAGVQRASAQCENWNGRVGPALIAPKAVFTCLLNLLYLYSAKRRVERIWGNQHQNASLRAADSLLTSVKI